MKNNRLTTGSIAACKAVIKDQTDEGQDSRLHTGWKLAFAIVALGGLGLASGCSTSQKSSASNSPPPATAYAEPASQPAVGGSATPGGQSTGTASSSTEPIMVRSDAITDPGALPNGRAAGYNGSFVYFKHMTVRRIFSQYGLEVSDDQGPNFCVVTEDTSGLKPGDIVLITGILREPGSSTTAMVKKDGYAMMYQPYYIEPQRIVIVQKEGG